MQHFFQEGLNILWACGLSGTYCETLSEHVKVMFHGNMPYLCQAIYGLAQKSSIMSLQSFSSPASKAKLLGSRAKNLLRHVQLAVYAPCLERSAQLGVHMWT